jgi:glutathione S-transferase
MADFVVHAVPGSPYCRAVLATLIEKGADWRLAPARPGSLHAPAHLARHPFGRIPAFEHGDFALYETQAILRYLDRALPVPPLTPADAQAAARMDQVMNICDWYLFQGVNDVIGFHRIVAPALTGAQPDEAAIAAAMPRAHVVFAELTRLLGEAPYFTGAGLSLADLMVAPHLDFLAATPEWADLTAERPKLVAWLARTAARPSLQATTWEKVSALAAAA